MAFVVCGSNSFINMKERPKRRHVHYMVTMDGGAFHGFGIRREPTFHPQGISMGLIPKHLCATVKPDSNVLVRCQTASRREDATSLDGRNRRTRNSKKY